LSKVLFKYYYDTRKNIGVDHPYLKEKDTPWAEDFLLSPVSKEIPSWFKAVPPKSEEDTDIYHADTQTLRFCPSFMNFFRSGYVVKNMIDFEVSKTEDGGYRTLTGVHDFPHVSTHGDKQFGEGYPFPKGYIPFSFKFTSPYKMVPSRDVVAMIQPCWWSHTNELVSAIPGMINLPKGVHYQYNINSFIKEPQDGKPTLIPALTPLAHLFFFDEVDTKFERDDSMHDTKEAAWWRTKNVFYTARRSIIKPVDRMGKFLMKGSK